MDFLNDLMCSFHLKPKYKHSDWEVRAEAVEKLDDEKKLMEIAINDERKYVRITATKKVNEEVLLANIAKNITRTEDKEIGSIALNSVNNSSLLVEVALNARDEEIRKIAFEKINDEKVLIEFLRKSTSDCKWNWYFTESEEFIKKVTDRDLLIDIAQMDSIYYNLRRLAMKKINDETILVDIIKNNHNNEIREDAISIINNESILLDIARNDKNISVYALDRIYKKEVLTTITNQDLINLINSGKIDLKYQCMLIDKINDVDYLIDTIRNDSLKRTGYETFGSYTVFPKRKCADMRLKEIIENTSRSRADIEMCKKIVKSLNNKDNRKDASFCVPAAIKKIELSDPEFLKE